MNRLHAAARSPLLLGLLLLGWVLALPAQGGTRRLIITLRSSNNQAALRAPGSPPVTGSELAQIAARLDRDLPTLREFGRAPFAGMLFAEVSDAEAVQLATDPNVSQVEEDRLWTPADAVASLARSDRWSALRLNGTTRADAVPWGVTQVTAPAVWATGNRGAGVKVAVLDSGIDTAHPDLSVVGGYNAVTGAAANYSDDLGICNGHGTHIAGTIAALENGTGVVGVAPSVQLYAIKVFQDVSGQCLAFTSTQISGLNWAVTQGIRLVNVSIGGTGSSFSYDAAMQAAAAAGTYVIAAAGNSGGAMLFPGASPMAIGVGALDGSNVRASWSSTGPEIDFSAPGVSINSTMPGGGYGIKSGTSMATPHVVGVAALILAAQPGLSFAGLRQKLQDGALDVDAAGFDSNTGWGLVRALNSLSGSPPPPVPLTLALSPSSRSTSAQINTAAAGSNATVTLAGDNASTTGWSAAKRKAWTTLTTANGTGSGTVAWSRSTAGLAVGTYVDTITVTVAGVTPRTVIDTLSITAAPVPLTLALSPSSRSTSAQINTAAAGSNATVTLAGDNATTTGWSAAKRKAWTTLTTASGTGSGTVAWSRSTAGLAVGTYVDTITVTVAGVTPRTVIDTLSITAAPVPLTLALSPSSRSTSAQINTAAAGSNATVTLAGDNASTTGWSAAKRKAWTTLTTANGTGSGTVAWSRSTTGLAVGTYVDTITVTVAGVTPRTVIDTLSITAAPVPLTLALSPSSRSTSAQINTAAAGSNATVTLAGDNASTTGWSAAKRKAWTTLTTANGTGSGTVAWSRSTTGLAVGTYVDTITVTVAGVTPRTVIDTLSITAAPVPLTLALSPSSRSTSAQINTAAAGSNATVTLAGDNASTTGWSAAKRKAWTTLTTANGTGSGTVAWSRSTAGLAVGTYVDTITVTVAGVTPRTVIDTLSITAAPVPLTVALSPVSHLVTVPRGSNAASGSGSLTLGGAGAAGTEWTAARQKSWTSLTSGSGIGSGTVAWNRNTATLAAGTYVDTITVSAGGVSARLIDSVVVSAPTGSTIAVRPRGRKSRYLTQFGQATAFASTRDSAMVEGEVIDQQGDSWAAATAGSNLVVLSTTGRLGEYVIWERRGAGSTPGYYIDSVQVELISAPNLRAIFVDTLEVVAVQLPEVGAAVEELVRGSRLDDDQRQLLDHAGNRNGIFDLGDFLAWVDRDRIRLSPIQVARLQSLPAVSRPRP